jgi:surfactin synthase thioesterase subunit
MRPTSDPWIARQPTRFPARLRLFCLPYAGGGARIFRTWADALPGDVQVCALQLPGRDQRLADPPIKWVAEAVDVLSAALRRYLDMPFAFFGHSMGAVLAYEVSRRLFAAFGQAPTRLFVSGHSAPHLPRRRPSLHHLPDTDFVAGVRALNGTPVEVFDHPELVDLLLPMLRADFELVETYAELAGPRLSCPVTAMGGDSDAYVPPEDLDAWRSVTCGPFESILFEGGHFYVNSAREMLLRALHCRLVPPAGPSSVCCS